MAIICQCSIFLFPDIKTPLINITIFRMLPGIYQRKQGRTNTICSSATPCSAKFYSLAVLLSSKPQYLVCIAILYSNRMLRSCRPQLPKVFLDLYRYFKAGRSPTWSGAHSRKQGRTNTICSSATPCSAKFYSFSLMLSSKPRHFVHIFLILLSHYGNQTSHS